MLLATTDEVLIGIYLVLAISFGSFLRQEAKEFVLIFSAILKKRDTNSHK
jgi:hypothetical protein